MYKLSVENSSGEILTLSGNNNYTVYNVEGLTPPQATINRSVNTTQDGSVINSARVESRNIVIYMTIEGDVEANRINLYKYFTPKREIKIYFSNDSRDVYIEGMVELIECGLFSNKQIAQISIICAKPYFRDVESFITTFSDISALFSFPFSISSTGIEISTAQSNIRKTILYAGDVESGIVIQLYANGTVKNPILYDVFKRTFFKLNMTLSEGDTVEINTNIGEKSITLLRNGVTSNALGYMSPDSSWLTLAAGDNVFTYDCDSGGSYLDITFTTSLLYGGV